MKFDSSAGEVRRYIYKRGGIYGVRAKSISVVIDFGGGGEDEECANTTPLELLLFILPSSPPKYMIPNSRPPWQ